MELSMWKWESQEPLIKIRREGGKAIINTQSRGGIVTGHYFNFICDTMSLLDKHEEFKDCYIVMDNAPIHKNADIEKEMIGL